MPYELFDHTADLGLRATAPDQGRLFAQMAAALTAALVEDPNAVRPLQGFELHLSGGPAEYLLVDWLKELLWRYEDDRFLVADCDVVVRPDGLSATIRGEPFDPEWHALSHEVKAVTYHGLKVERQGEGWVAEAIVDI